MTISTEARLDMDIRWRSEDTGIRMRHRIHRATKLHKGCMLFLFRKHKKSIRDTCCVCAKPCRLLLWAFSTFALILQTVSGLGNLGVRPLFALNEWNGSLPGTGSSASIKGLRLAIKWRPSSVGIYFPIASLWRKPSSYLIFLVANLAMVPGLIANSDESAKSGGKWRKW
jgi:hypothetical protein